MAEWDRMTVGRLKEIIDESLENGSVTADTVVFVDSDPEGNDSHPLRDDYGPAAVRSERVRGGDTLVLDDEVEDVELPAPALWIGVGY